MNKDTHEGENVVLLHGILRTRFSMSMLGRKLTKAGFNVINIGYSNHKFSLEQIADYVHAKLERKHLTNGPIHFVGFSMGGLVIRAYLQAYPPQRLGRVVMIGTPNHGSEVADHLVHRGWYRMLFGVSGAQLVTRAEVRKNLLVNASDFELGVIAGNRSFFPAMGWKFLGEHDGKVSVESTKLPGMKDHIVLPLSHSFLAVNARVYAQVAHFLKQGGFSR